MIPNANEYRKHKRNHNILDVFEVLYYVIAPHNESDNVKQSNIIELFE